MILKFIVFILYCITGRVFFKEYSLPKKTKDEKAENVNLCDFCTYEEGVCPKTCVVSDVIDNHYTILGCDAFQNKK